jgi:hypothetical protein
MTLPLDPKIPHFAEFRTALDEVGESAALHAFVARQNIKNVKAKLLTSSDEVEKAMLRKLLIEAQRAERL